MGTLFLPTGMNDLLHFFTTPLLVYIGTTFPFYASFLSPAANIITFHMPSH